MCNLSNISYCDIRSENFEVLNLSLILKTKEHINHISFFKDILYLYIAYILNIYILSVGLHPIGGSPNRKTQTHVCPIHFSPLFFDVNPSRTSCTELPQPATWHLHTSCWRLTNSMSHPLHILRTLTFTSWMFRPFLANTFFTPSNTF